MNDDHECIFGSRFCLNGKMLNSNFTRYFFSKFGSLLSKLFFPMKISDTTSGYQMFQKKILHKILNNKKKDIINKLTALGAQNVDYIECLNVKNLEYSKNSKDNFNIFVAYYLNSVRLIANL